MLYDKFEKNRRMFDMMNEFNNVDFHTAIIRFVRIVDNRKNGYTVTDKGALAFIRLKFQKTEAECLQTIQEVRAANEVKARMHGHEIWRADQGKTRHIKEDWTTPAYAFIEALQKLDQNHNG